MKSVVKRFRVSAHRGVTLVELMVAMLILAIVCVAWLEIIGIQSARKEARRREAVERLAGMMDAFMYDKKAVDFSFGDDDGGYKLEMNGDKIKFEPKAGVHEFEPDLSPIGYQLCVVPSGDKLVEHMSANWGSCRWLVGLLYDNINSDPKVFFKVSVCLAYGDVY